MKLNLIKTLKSIEKYLAKGRPTVDELRKAYDLTLRLRSQLLSVIYDMEQFVVRKEYLAELISQNADKHVDKDVVTLIIIEALPGKKELTSAVEEHWINMIHKAIAEESKTGIPKFNKAFVMIHITAARGTNNLRTWDVSNRAINVIINNLKGIFFKDDDFENMCCWTSADWGDSGRTVIKICEYDKFVDPNSDEIFDQMVEES